MESAIVVGTGERAETVDCYDFAKIVMSRVSVAALDLALQKRSIVAGRLATELYIAREALGSTENPKVQRRVPKLLSDLERICAWPKQPSSNMAIIHALVDNRDLRAEYRAQKGILCFANSSQNVIDQYFKKLSRFSKDLLDKDDIGSGTNKKSLKGNGDEYPEHFWSHG
ncbi:putative subtilisin [Colletotrichum sp. SAR 10_66]|nr:putative subtilisin [Colletotrichum sp. SAR 10_66]